MGIFLDVTVTTVGYGDRFPVTAGGRCVAAVLMMAGMKRSLDLLVEEVVRLRKAAEGNGGESE